MLRQGSLLREEDSSIEFRTLTSMFASTFTSSPYWSVRLWLRHLEREGGPKKKRFQHCIDPYWVYTIFYLRCIQGHSGEEPVDPSLQDHVMLPNDFVEYNYHNGNSHDLRSIIKSGLIAGWKDAKKERHTIFFTAVDAMRAHLHVQREFDLTKLRVAIYTQNWKVHQNSVYRWTWSLLKDRDWRSTKQGRTRSFSTTHSHHAVLKR